MNTDRNKPMKYYHSLFSLLLVCVLFSEILQTSAKEIFIITINDFHGHLTQGKDEPGVAKFYSAIKQLKKQIGANDDNSILVSNGDSHQGTYYADITKGDILSILLKHMNVKISSIGNHQFEYGLHSFTHWAKDGGFQFISANIVQKNGGAHFAKPYTIVNIDGIDIAFVGATTLQTPFTTSSQVQQLTFLDPTEAISEHIYQLKHDKGVDFIIALAHIGSHQNSDGQITLDESKKMTDVKQLDAIITGHSHQKVAGYLNGKPVIQACCYGKCIGVLKISTKTRQIVPMVVQVNKKYPDIQPEQTLDMMVKEQLEYYSQLGDLVVTNVNKAMDYQEIAQFICNKTLQEYGKKVGLQFVIMNGGLIRIDIGRGQLTMNTLHSIIPFENTLVFITLKGNILKKNIQHTKVMFPQRKRGKISGDVQNIKDDKFYKVAVTSFMHPNGDKYMFQNATDVVDTGILIRDLLLKYWKSQERPADEQL